MAIHQRSFLFIAIISVIILLAGCGGGSTAISFPPPQGGFNNSNLTGAFAFSYTGTDGGGFLAVAGSFVSDGAGHITSGMQDINSGLGIATNAAITGTYTVRADGRGSASLASPAGNTTVDFVLVAGGHALVTRFDANAAGSGTIDQQTAAAFSNTALAGTYAFSISGIDTINNPMSMVGNFTADNTGALTAGIEDSNDNGGLLTNDPVTGSIPVASTGRGTATFTTGRGTLSFAYYVVDATHLKLVETDSGTALSGDAFSQTGPFSNASVTGPFAFTIAGSDIAGGVPFAAGGVLTSDGAGNVTGGAEDFNDGGTITSNAALTGTYALASTGRGTLTITTSGGPANFIFYPSSGGLLVMETDLRFNTSGTALQQTGTFSAATLSGTYGLNFTGATASGELDSIAQFTANGASTLSGIIDLNNTGGITFGQPLTGTFSAATNGRTTSTLKTPLGTQNIVVYMVNANRALFIELDSGLVAAGDIRHQ